MVSKKSLTVTAAAIYLLGNMGCTTTPYPRFGLGQKDPTDVAGYPWHSSQKSLDTVWETDDGVKPDHMLPEGARFRNHGPLAEYFQSIDF
jgi:hypothetical protein